MKDKNFPFRKACINGKNILLIDACLYYHDLKNEIP